MNWLDLATTLGIVAAGVVLVALLLDWTIRRYVILAPNVPSYPPKVDSDDDR
jgi:hypothetical protein